MGSGADVTLFFSATRPQQGRTAPRAREVVGPGRTKHRPESKPGQASPSKGLTPSVPRLALPPHHALLCLPCPQKGLSHFQEAAVGTRMSGTILPSLLPASTTAMQKTQCCSSHPFLFLHLLQSANT